MARLALRLRPHVIGLESRYALAREPERAMNQSSNRHLRTALAMLAAMLSTLPILLHVEAQNQPDRGLQAKPGQDGRLLPAGDVKELPAKGKRFALVIGVDEYQDTQISRLSGATNDARTLVE